MDVEAKEKPINIWRKDNSFRPDEQSEGSHPTRVVLFCGGRGSATITHELLRQTNVSLTLIVNAYDDGLSTGALREFISQMLGPSDFRKNLSYLLDPFSEAQYNLKNLLEFRLPNTIKEEDVQNLIKFIESAKLNILIDPLRELFSGLSHPLSFQVRRLLQTFFNYAKEVNLEFDFRDCSVGNLIFAGAYLENNHNFNAAAKAMSTLVNSRALLINVSKGENRILIGLKENGELLVNEAQIVGSQSTIPIRNIFLMPHPVSINEWEKLADKSVDEKEIWLRNQEILPQISPEAELALQQADVIIYGPGTQHSSLLPSYRISHQYLKNSPAVVKAIIMNLDHDHDIQAFTAADIVDRALSFIEDSENVSNVITHVFIDKTCNLDQAKLLDQTHYKNIQIVRDEFVTDSMPRVHNGRAVVEKINFLQNEMRIHHSALPATMDIFIDMDKRSSAIDSLYQEFVEMDWKKYVTSVSLIVNQARTNKFKTIDSIHIKQANLEGTFPEIGYFADWLNNQDSEYLVLLTGDGEYRFRDVMLAIKLLQQSHFGAVFGTRNQSRQQFKVSLLAAYGDKKILSTLSFFGAFLMSAAFAFRFGIIFSDPLTGFRIFKRSKIAHLKQKIVVKKKSTPITIAKYLIKNNVEIAELPVSYRIFSGFTDPYWRICRGMKSLLSTFTRGIR